jgi:hypothetical protein
MRFSIISITLAFALLVAGAPVDQPRGDLNQARAETAKTGSHKSPATASKSGTGKSCPALAGATGSKPPKKVKRAGSVTHPSGKKDIVLFHGTLETSSVTSIEKGVKLSATPNDGDLHHPVEEIVDGGFYMSDSLVGAAQNVCQLSSEQNQIVNVVELKWNGAKLDVKDYPAGTNWDKIKADGTLTAALRSNVMITGPQNSKGLDDHLTKYSWQYAVVKQTAATSNLKYVTVHKISCSAIPIADQAGDETMSTLYSSGQRTNPAFDQLVKGFTGCEGPFDWPKTVGGG